MFVLRSNELLHLNSSILVAKIRHPPDEVNDALARDGVVCVRGAIPSDWLTVIESGIEIARNGASADVDIVKRAQDSGSFSVSSSACTTRVAIATRG